MLSCTVMTLAHDTDKWQHNGYWRTTLHKIMTLQFIIVNIKLIPLNHMKPSQMPIILIYNWHPSRPALLLACSYWSGSARQ